MVLANVASFLFVGVSRSVFGTLVPVFGTVILFCIPSFRMCPGNVCQKVLQGTGQGHRGGGAVLLHVYGSPDRSLVQQNEPFLP